MATLKKAIPVLDPAPLVTAQPQSPQAAAPQQQMFLYTDDKWSWNYFDSNDLHFVERQLFG